MLCAIRGCLEWSALLSSKPSASPYSTRLLKREIVTVTKRGRPIATLGPVHNPARRSSEGILKGKVHIPEAYLMAGMSKRGENKARRNGSEAHTAPRYPLACPLACRTGQALSRPASCHPPIAAARHPAGVERRHLDGTGVYRASLASPLPEIPAASGSEADFRILEIDIPIAAEIHAPGIGQREPADRTIVATARAHRLRLVTSDQRIIQSGLANVVE